MKSGVADDVSDEQITRGMRNPDWSVRLAWANRPFHANGRQMEIGTRDPDRRVRIAWIDRINRSVDQKLLGRLQGQLAHLEGSMLETLRKQHAAGGPEWDVVEIEARTLRQQLWALTGDSYGRHKDPRVAMARPDDDELNARIPLPGVGSEARPGLGPCPLCADH